MESNIVKGIMVDKTFQGAIIISAFKGSDLVKQQYIGYSLREAKRLFSVHFNSLTQFINN